MSNYLNIIYSHKLPHEFGKFSIRFQGSDRPQIKFEAFGTDFIQVNTVKMFENGNQHIYITIEQTEGKKLQRLIEYLLQEKIITRTLWMLDLDFQQAKGIYDVYEYIGMKLATIEKQ